MTAGEPEGEADIRSSSPPLLASSSALRLRLDMLGCERTARDGRLAMEVFVFVCSFIFFLVWAAQGCCEVGGKTGVVEDRTYGFGWAKVYEGVRRSGC